MPLLASMIATIALALGAAEGSEGRTCPPPGPAWLHPGGGFPAHRIMFDVRLRGSEILWLNRPISRRMLRTYLRRAKRIDPSPFIVFDPTEASDCAAAATILGLIDAEARCGERTLCGQGTRREWLASDSN